MRPVKTPLIPAILFIAFALTTQGAQATTWSSINLPELVHRHAEIVAIGKVIKEEEEPGPERGRIGIIEVSDMIYGPRSLKRVRLRMQSNVHGNNYKVGDEGFWFLRPRAEGPDHTPVVVLDPPVVELDRSAVIFEAEHPSTFWPLGRDQPLTKSGAEAIVELRQLVKERLAANIPALAEALESAKAVQAKNQAALAPAPRQAATTPAPAAGEKPFTSNTWLSPGLPYLVGLHADMIVRGRITREKQWPPGGPRSPIGILEVQDVVYGPRSFKIITLRLDAEAGGNTYQVGDEGVWLLRRWRFTADEVLMDAMRSNPPMVPEIHPRDDDDDVGPIFQAEHPATFWPRDPKATKRFQDRRASEADMAELRQLANLRIKADIPALVEALDSAKAAQERNDAALAAAEREATQLSPEARLKTAEITF